VLLQAAEVGLLSRNILITSVPDPQDRLIGGHFVVYQTSIEQTIVGVEFARMGQQGRLGRCDLEESAGREREREREREGERVQIDGKTSASYVIGVSNCKGHMLDGLPEHMHRSRAA
jgi:hypothetical protein